MPLFSGVITPQSIDPESSIVNRILGSTELLKNSGESDNVPGAAETESGPIKAQVIRLATAAVLNGVVLIFTILVPALVR